VSPSPRPSPQPISSTSLAETTTTSAAATEALGARLAEQLEPGDVVVVSGEVGAGKTTLIRGACRALGIEGPVTSPTFTIGHRYTGGRLPVSHLDLYRLLDGLEGEEPALLDDYLVPGSVAFVEWPAVAEPQLAGYRIVPVRLTHGGGDSRTIELPAASRRK
jgi:tRNA threonylcarbamoyladenosine biosynthesis protein TsaE